MFRAITDSQGNYRLVELPPATDYTVDAAQAGFENFEHVGLVVEAGLNVTVNIPLKLGAQTEKVVVSGDASSYRCRERPTSRESQRRRVSWSRTTTKA